MFARKTVASGALSKKLNEQLKASQAQHSNSNSYKSASEGEGPWSSNSEKAQESPSKKKREGECGDERGKGKGVVDHSPTTDLSVLSIYGVVQENVEESGKNSRGSGSGKAAEGLVNLSSRGDEPSSSSEETLADLLKKVEASYDPKKRRTPTPKAPSAPKPSKKRKASSPTTTELSLPKGIATRSRVKQSESDLQKALAESKKKRMAKGKGKVVESSEAADIEEMEQSTRSAVKSKQVRVSEDEEWSGEEENETDGEQDKLSMFGKRNILKGRLLKDLVEPGMVRLVTPPEFTVIEWKLQGIQESVTLLSNPQCAIELSHKSSSQELCLLIIEMFAN
ncbi:uncharacterized protein [Nicotiana sylvestris]|uniref:uncharacterized protein n=1 Tax=Nicotiana sylvestris TaxID=4096 RepID=UPI00388C3BCC